MNRLSARQIRVTPVPAVTFLFRLFLYPYMKLQDRCSDSDTIVWFACSRLSVLSYPGTKGAEQNGKSLDLIYSRISGMLLKLADSNVFLYTIPQCYLLIFWNWQILTFSCTPGHNVIYWFFFKLANSNFFLYTSPQCYLLIFLNWQVITSSCTPAHNVICWFVTQIVSRETMFYRSLEVTVIHYQCQMRKSI